MCLWLRRFSLCAFTILLCSVLSAAGDLESAKRAYQDKDYAKAFKEVMPLAAQGNADAQFYLGSFYLLPHRDIAEGAKWLRISAEQGNQDAQWLLGKAYLQGDKELPRDPVLAEMWLRLAAKDNLEFYENTLRAAEGQMTADQVAKGKALAEAWKPKSALSSSTGKEK